MNSPAKLDKLTIVDGDFVLNKINVRKHFSLNDKTPVLKIGDPTVTKALCNLVESEYQPLYMCYCGDLYCGYFSVKVEVLNDVVIWQNFGYFCPWSAETGEGFSQDKYCERMRAYTFDRKEYKYQLSPYK